MPCCADMYPYGHTRFEKLAQDGKRQLEMLQLAQAQGLDPPSHHFELKTFQTVRCQSLRETVAPCRCGVRGCSQRSEALVGRRLPIHEELTSCFWSR